MEIKSDKPKLGQDQIAKEYGCLGSTLKRYRNDINMLSPYRISQNSHIIRQKVSNTNLDDNSNCERGLKTPSNDPKRPQMIEIGKLVPSVV